MMISRRGEPEIVLDLSRLLSRILYTAPTGVDRVEMAYARGLMAIVPHRLRFAAKHPVAGYGRLDPGAVRAFLEETELRWYDATNVGPFVLRRRAIRQLWSLRPRPVPRLRHAPRRFYILPSPNNLHDPRLIAAILAKEDARLVCLVHDLIPIQYPEYARPNGAARHQQRIKTVLDQADGILTNSHATLRALAPHMEANSRRPALRVAHLGTETRNASAGPAAGRPYFVCVGTIEPRKNHLLLLHLWRDMAERHGTSNVPMLVLVGRRGWENEQVVDLLERCPALVGCVEEAGSLSDRAAQALIAGASALLMPSFAEGYGMPVSEAIALGVPVLCSDLPALREAGGGVPHYLDPTDGPAWMRAIVDLVDHASQLSRVQAERRADWHPPGWNEHFAILIDLLAELAG